jgi:hypothetical protein
MLPTIYVDGPSLLGPQRFYILAKREVSWGIHLESQSREPEEVEVRLCGRRSKGTFDAGVGAGGSRAFGGRHLGKKVYCWD